MNAAMRPPYIQRQASTNRYGFGAQARFEARIKCDLQVLSPTTPFLFLGDNRYLLRALPDNCVDSIVTDPPYEIRLMGAKWDGTGIAYSVAFWRECLRVLKPGGILLAFGGTRTAHRMVCAIDDAGFTIENTLHTPCWFFASGLPKSKRQLKPAWEPVCMAFKPKSETNWEANAERWGTGELNIDACRLEGRERTDYGLGNAKRTCGAVYNAPTASADFDSSKGRWPSNVYLSPSDARRMDAQSGILKSGKPSGTRKAKSGFHNSEAGSSVTGYGDSGGASRFFHKVDFESDELDYLDTLYDLDVSFSVDYEGAPLYYVAKATQAERHAGLPSGTKNIHPAVKPVALLESLLTLVTPPGGIVLDPFMGSGSEALAALRRGFRYIGAEQERDYFAIAQARAVWQKTQLGTPCLFANEGITI